MAGPSKKGVVKTSKSSDRRMAGDRQASSYLHNAIVKTDIRNTDTTRIVSNLHSKNTGNNKTVKRRVGDKSWEDQTLLEWDPKHFRLFVGNSAFSKYASMSKVKVPVDTKSGKNKGFGFVAFADANDYFQAFKDMNGKYIGQHPVQLKRAETQIKATKKKR
ncbi:hypothetical protein G9P44_001329 [Scheffersomyces stipitis]|nr:hypothetical protein G9P44_001329 [Scheffersomyces stipitis]